MPLTINIINKLPILEIISLNLYSTPMAILIVGLIIDFIFLHRYLDKQKISSFFLGFYSLLFSPVDQHRGHSILTKNTNSNSESLSTKHEKKDQSVCRSGDVEMVLRSLGLFFKGDQDNNNNNNNNRPAMLDIDDILNIFEEKNISLDDVKYAFDVFDENRDGFIDAKELQKVLCALRFKEELEMEKCRSMIGVFDENGDGKIDFDEFVKLMKNSFQLL